MDRLYTVGHIVLRQMNGSFVEFRKIEIKELNSVRRVPLRRLAYRSRSDSGGGRASISPLATAPSLAKGPVLSPVHGTTSTKRQVPAPVQRQGPDRVENASETAGQLACRKRRPDRLRSGTQPPLHGTR